MQHATGGQPEQCGPSHCLRAFTVWVFICGCALLGRLVTTCAGGAVGSAPVQTWARCRDRVASYSATTQYDQLMGATYDDSHVFERGGEIEPQAAGQRDAPVLKVSVKDPVKKVPRLPPCTGVLELITARYSATRVC